MPTPESPYGPEDAALVADARRGLGGDEAAEKLAEVKERQLNTTNVNPTTTLSAPVKRQAVETEPAVQELVDAERATVDPARDVPAATAPLTGGPAEATNDPDAQGASRRSTSRKR